MANQDKYTITDDSSFEEIIEVGGNHAFGVHLNTTRTAKPIYIAHELFSFILGERQELKEDFYQFAYKPSKIPTSDLPDDQLNLFVPSGSRTNEKVDNIRRALHSVLHGDTGFYTGYTYAKGPTVTSEWLVTEAEKLREPARYIYTLVEGDSIIENATTEQLQETSDGISMLCKPVVDEDGDVVLRNSKSEFEIRTYQDEGFGPKLATSFGDGTISQEMQDGLVKLTKNLRSDDSESFSPRDLKLIVRYGILAYCLYCVNRAKEIRGEDSRETWFPIFLNYTGTTTSEAAEISNKTLGRARSELVSAMELGIANAFKQSEAGTYEKIADSEDEDLIQVLVENGPFEIDESDETILSEKRQLIRSLFATSQKENNLDRLAYAVNRAGHMDIFSGNTSTPPYVPRDTLVQLCKYTGIIQPSRGVPTKDLYFQFDRPMLEAIVLSVLDPDESERLALPKVCDRLRERYGILIGGAREIETQDHLSEWDVDYPDSGAGPLSQAGTNYREFEKELVKLDLANEYADRVTIVSANE